MIQQISAVHSRFGSTVVQFKQLGQQASKKWDSLPWPPPGVRNSSCLAENHDSSQNCPASKAGGFEYTLGFAHALLSFHFSPAPWVLLPRPAGEHTGVTQPSLPPAWSPEQQKPLVITGSASYIIPQGNKLVFPDGECLGCRIIQMLLLRELRARERTGLCPWSPSFQEMPVLDFHLSLTTAQGFQSHLGQDKNIQHRLSNLMISEYYQICQ